MLVLAISRSQEEENRLLLCLSDFRLLEFRARRVWSAFESVDGVWSEFNEATPGLFGPGANQDCFGCRE